VFHLRIIDCNQVLVNLNAKVQKFTDEVPICTRYLMVYQLEFRIM